MVNQCMSDTQQSTTAPDGSARQTPPPSPRRSWWRLHFSTWAVIAVVLAILTMIVVPGSPNNHEVLVAAPLFYEHGWPFVFLDRYVPPPPARASPDEFFKFLKDSRDKEGLRWAMSGVEFLVRRRIRARRALLVGWGPVAGEGRIPYLGCRPGAGPRSGLRHCGCRRVRLRMLGARRWQYRLRSLLGAFLIIAMGLGWWRHSIDEYQRDSQATAVLRKKGLDVHWRCDGLIWLVKLVGSNPGPALTNGLFR